MTSPVLAKITRPKLTGVSPRERLFRLLDQESNKPVVWVAAQAGSGKTTLVAGYLDARTLPCLWYQVDESDGDIASFFYYMGQAAKMAAPRFKKPLPHLTSEYFQGIPVFTRRYFEELFRRVAERRSPASEASRQSHCDSRRFVVVLDNVHEAPPASGFHDMLAHALDVVPEGVQIIAVSRGELPFQMTRLRANNRLSLLGGDVVRFTPEESRAMLQMQDRGLSDQKIDLLHAKTEGWAAGLVLLMSGTAAADLGSSSPGLAQSGGLFEYFASEIFGKSDAVMQDVLLKTSFLPRIDPGTAERLTENGTAGRILERLSRDHYFTQKYGQVYQYHPLYREFLQARAKDRYTPAEIASIRRKAAALLEEKGRIEEAVALSIEAADWEGAVRLILQQGSILVSQGRSSTLEGWLDGLPRTKLEEAPWLLYWYGQCRMLLNPYEGREYLTRAFDRFKSCGDLTGMLYSWACISETMFYGWGEKRGRWVREFEELAAAGIVFPSEEIEMRATTGMFSHMLSYSAQRSDVVMWERKVAALAHACANMRLYMHLNHFLMIYHLWIGDFSRAGAIARSLRAPGGDPEEDPFPHLIRHAILAMYAWVTADGETCFRSVRSGLELAERTGMHFMDPYLFKYGISAAVSLGHPAIAAELIGRMSALTLASPMDRAFYHYLSSLVCWRNGDIERAVSDGELAWEIVGDFEQRIPPFCSVLMLAVVCYDGRRYDAATRHLGRARELAAGAHYLEYIVFLVSAWFALEQGREEECLRLVRRAMRLGAQQGYMNFAWWQPVRMSRLCAIALEQGIEVDYVRRLITGRGLVPERPVENWPWPASVRTLGRFQVLKDDAPVMFSGKVQRKPLEMLKAMIAFGGTDVAEERLTEALWPDADGDQAHHAFETTLYRLRKLLGDNVLGLQNGLLTLDRRHCRVDVWEFEPLADEVLEYAAAQSRESKSKKERPPVHGDKPQSDIQERFEKAVLLYRGHFLPTDGDQPWSLSLRERLRGKFSRLAVGLGRFREESGEWEKALSCFELALWIDDLNEEFYRHSIACLIELGRHDQAATVYERCRSALERAFGVSPSPRTEALYASLRPVRAR